MYRGREVILSGGTYGSAAILLRSGVGPAGELAALGIAVIADLPGRPAAAGPPRSCTPPTRWIPGYLQPGRAASALLWTASSEAAPGELDLHIVAARPAGRSLQPHRRGDPALRLGRPAGVGRTLKLASRDPDDAPLIDANFLAPAATPAACWKASS